MSVIAANSISLSFGERTLFEPVSFEIQAGEKVALIGANGCGKTTLFKLLTGKMQPDTGGILRQKGLRIGYMEQIVASDSSESAYDFALDIFSELQKLEAELERLGEQLSSGDTDIIERHARLRERFEAEGGLTYRACTRSALLGLGLSVEQLALPLKSLSGGQLSKLSLARLLLSEPQLMLLDEPTNHLDMESITALNNGLIKFPGVLLFSSRDHQIVETTANRIMEILPNGKLIDKITTYDEYLESDEMARKRQVYSADETVSDN